MKVFIERMGINCEGIGKIPNGDYKGKLIFVNNAIDGELVDVDIVSEKKTFCTGDLNGVISPSTDRCNPKCSFFGICGGCDIQHINEKKQDMVKTNAVIQNIKKISQIDVECKKIIRVNDFGYRNKMVFPIGAKDGKFVIGMYAKKSHDIVEIDKCLLANDTINNILKLTKSYFENISDNKLLEQLKYLVVRNVGVEVLVTIVAKGKVNLKDYYLHLNSVYKHLGVSLIIGNSNDEILSGEYVHVSGLKFLTITEFGVCYKVDNMGFLQVNNDIKKLIYESILNEVDKGDIVIDAYAGAGLLTSIISRKAKCVVGIEINKSASNSAKKLLEENNIENVKFICGDVSDFISRNINKECVIILDPPRSGCERKVIDKIIGNSNNVKKIIYLSCDHATLSRDLKILKEKFEVITIQPYDMFPNTRHVETLVVLERKD